MKKYDITEKKFSELKDSIEIPKFQRGLVWGMRKKEELIKSLKEGLPIGVLLLYQRNDKYLVIDGLQRFTTMKEYSKDYFAYIETEEITDRNIMDVIMSSNTAGEAFDRYTSENKEKLKESIRKIIVNCISESNGKNINTISWDATNKLCLDLSEFCKDDKVSIQSTIYSIVDDFSKTANIDDVVIPMILFKGEESELASIYQKLNQEGVKLSKYDVFAATWIDHMVKVENDDEFIDLIVKKYQTAEEASDLDISDFDEAEIKSTGELTVFEYAFGIGKALSKACNYLMPTYDESKVDSIGFVILAELFGLSYGKMEDLAKKIDASPNINYKELKDKIVEVCKEVEEALSTNIIAPTPNKTSLACHSELQLVSYIVVLFKLKYEISETDGLIKRSGKNQEIGSFKKYLYKHYLYDIIRGTWSGSGDSKLAEITSKADTCQYLLDVDKSSFEQSISDWLDRAISKTEQKQVPKINKLFLNYLLRGRIGSIGRGKYDIEHCVPQKVIEKYFLERNIVVPVSSVCNTVYIPASDNRGKRDKTYYQKQDDEPTAYELSEDQLKKYVYPTRDELRFVESTSTLTQDNYFDFLNKRKIQLKEAMIDVLYTS